MVDKREAELAQQALQGLKILVVDDEPDARLFIATLLEDHGAITVEASDGYEALEMARRHQPDLVTLDLGMPGKNGVEVYQEMRRDAELRTIPVCIVSGRPELRSLIYERSTAPPPEGHINKPVSEEALLRNLRRIIQLRHKQRVRETVTTSPI